MFGNRNVQSVCSWGGCGSKSVGAVGFLELVAPILSYQEGLCKGIIVRFVSMFFERIKVVSRQSSACAKTF